MTFDRRTRIGAVVGAVVIVILVAVLATRHDGSTASSTSTSVTTSTVPGASTTTVASTTSTTSGPFTTPKMPLSVTVPATTGLRSGSKLTFHVAPTSGSVVYGAEARLCRADASVTNDGEFIPTQGGNCTPEPLAPDTDARVTVNATPPYQGVDLTFTVGTGTHTWPLQSGKQASITCDGTHPCQLVLKLQYPAGFGFQGVPISF